MDTLKRLKSRFGSMLTILLIGVLTYIALYAMLVVNITPEQYDLRAGMVSPITITASRDVEDTLATQQMINTAVAAVQPTYISDAEAQNEVLSDLASAFNRLESVRQWEIDPEAGIGETLLLQAQHTLRPIEMNESTLKWLLTADEAGLTGLRQDLIERVTGILTDKLAEGREEETIVKLTKDLETAGYDEGAVGLARQLLDSYLQPNLLVDVDTYELKKSEVAAAVEPIIYLKGRNIVKSGEIVTKAQIAMLESLGMLKSNSSLDIMMLLGLALLLFLLMFVVVIYIRIFLSELLDDPLKVGLLSAIFLVTTGLCLLCQQLHAYFMPVTLGVMLTTLLLKTRLALIVNIALAVLCGLTASGMSGVFTASMFSIMLTAIVSGSLCVAIMRKRQQRVAILIAGLGVGTANVVTAFAVNLISSTGSLGDFAWMAWSAGSGLLSAVLCIGLQPALEWMFNLVTSAKLLELSNPNQPLIRRLILEASGTYHHSIIVANLSEAAADSIGANGLLARVGAYYHDIGKLKRPLYFKENQMGDNPHDRTDPMVSTAILTSHPKDGVQLALKSRMPKPILDIIEQHHGDTPVIYFYDRYVKQNGAENADIEDFRYAGPKPQTREAAIVMLADTVEAAARSMPEPTLEKMDQLIHKLVRAKMDDGQLNESPLTLKDLECICKAFLTVLTGVFHQRVEYPKVEIPKKNIASAEDKAEAEKAIEKPAESAGDAGVQVSQNTEEEHGA